MFYKNLKPPIIPVITSEEDASNFEDYTDEDIEKVPPVSKKYLKLFDDF